MPIGANQTLREDDFENESTGAANKIPVTKSDGKLDESFFAAFSRTLLGIVVNRFAAISELLEYTHGSLTSANQSGSSTYTKIAELEINEDITRLRVKWTIARINTSGGGGDYRQSAIFVNGTQVQFPANFNVEGGSPTNLSFDIPGGLSAGDLLQVYVRKNTSTEQYLRITAMSLHYDNTISEIGGFELVEPLIISDPDGPDITENL